MLTYLFTHQVLRIAVFSGDPHALAWLEAHDAPDDDTDPYDTPLSLLIQQAVAALLAMSDLNSTEWVLEEHALYNGISLSTHDRGRDLVHVISMPAPRAEREAHFIAIVRQPTETVFAKLPPQFTHYFVFERGGSAEQVFLCEWLPNGLRHNYGLVTLPTSLEKAADLVIERVRQWFPDRAHVTPVFRRKKHPDSSGSLDAIPDCYDAYYFEDLHALIEYLERGNSHTVSRYAFRGQARRSPMLTRGEEADRADVEALFPNDFRFIREHWKREPTGEEISAIRQAGRDERDRFTSFLLDKAKSGHPTLTWLKMVAEQDDSFHQELFGPQNPLQQAEAGGDGSTSVDEMLRALISLHARATTTFDRWLYRACWSLAQHYGLSTSLLDLTSDPHVAAWFATNSWDVHRSYPCSGEGVIYRFDLLKIEALFGQMNAQYALEAENPLLPPPSMFVVHIDSIPEALAARPHGQSGLSLYGFDRATAVQYAFFAGAVQAFAFPHSAPYETDRVNRASIQPDSDPFLPILEEYKNHLAARRD